jgi:uncharacterized membrane protein YkvA (DUF1232 family)
MHILQSITAWARRIKRDAVTLWFAYRHPATPLLAKGLSILVVAYALSPIDLIPDFIPVLGYVDDALLLPALIWLTVRLVPRDVIAASRAKADQWMERQGKRPTIAWGALLILALWALAAYGVWRWAMS